MGANNYFKFFSRGRRRRMPSFLYTLIIAPKATLSSKAAIMTSTLESTLTSTLTPTLESTLMPTLTSTLESTLTPTPATKITSTLATKITSILATMLATIMTSTLLSGCAFQDRGTGAENPPTTAPEAFTAAETTVSAAGGRLEKILTSGEIIVATSPDFAPMEFIDNRNIGQEQYVGTDPWFAKFIADKLGVSLKIEAMSFDSLETAISSGAADLIMSGFAATENRAESLELSDFYNVTDDDGCGLIIRKDNLSNYHEAGDFKGKTIAVQADSPQCDYLQTQLPEAKSEFISHINDGVMLLITKKADALAIDGVVGRDVCENYPDLAMADFWFESDSEGNVIGMPKGETALCERINEIIALAASEGMFNKWRKDAESLAFEIGWQN